MVKWKVLVDDWGTSRIGKMKSEEIATGTLSVLPSRNVGVSVMSLEQPHSQSWRKFFTSDLKDTFKVAGWLFTLLGHRKASRVKLYDISQKDMNKCQFIPHYLPMKE